MRTSFEHIQYSPKGEINIPADEVFLTAEEIEVKKNYQISEMSVYRDFEE